MNGAWQVNMDYELQKQRYYWARELLIESTLLIQGKNCLDLGCGVGNMTLALKSLGAKTALGIDIDLSDQGISYLEEIAEEEHVDTTGCYLVEGDVDKYNFGHQFDIVTMYDVMEHITSPSHILRTVYRLLKPGGFLYIESSPLYYSPIGHHCWNVYGREDPWPHLYDPDFSDIILEKGGPWLLNNYKRLNKITTNEILTISKSTGFGLNWFKCRFVNDSVEKHPCKDAIIYKAPELHDLYIESIRLVMKKALAVE